MDYQEPPQNFTDIARLEKPALVQPAETPPRKVTFDLETRPATLDAANLSGGHIHSNHHQPNTRLNERHEFFALNFGYSDGTSIGVYTLTPNSVRKNSVGILFGKEFFSVGSERGLKLEVTGIVGGATGYLKAGLLMPIVGVAPRLQLFESKVADGRLSVGLSAMYMPYAMTDRQGKYHLNYISTSPFLSLRYTFGKEAEASRVRYAEVPEYQAPVEYKASSVLLTEREKTAMRNMQSGELSTYVSSILKRQSQTQLAEGQPQPARKVDLSFNQ